MPDRPLPSSLEGTTMEFTEETSLQKFKRRLKEEPLIPLGCAATCYALYRAYKSMKAKDSVEMNRMFRARIYAQFFTLLAVVAGGMYYKTERQQRREFERMLEERKNQEKREAWLRELEIRDKEDKGWRERHAAIEEAARQAVIAFEQQKQQQSSTSSSGSTDANANENQPTEPADEKRGGGILDAVKALVGRK
ncbi:hypothetical protein VTN77DRAFT_5037 [Rasamsonia byssochlamydoides]|uniref:uncharacterized protein n=1 Tax=Rasamsonia byssochlamydoides TaxID=89139 RepID=UPI0037440E58